jgi:hypothetical protein
LRTKVCEDFKDQCNNNALIFCEQYLANLLILYIIKCVAPVYFLILIAPSNLTLNIEQAQLIRIFQESANGLGFLRKFQMGRIDAKLFFHPSQQMDCKF